MAVRRGQVVMGGVIGMVVLAGLAIAVRLYMGRAGEAMLRPGETIAFDRPELPGTPNFHLVCPPSACAGATAAAAPVYRVPWQRLRDAVRDMIAAEPRITLVEEGREGRRLVYVQRSALFLFPDIVTVEILSLPEGASLAIFSRSRYGYSDLGANRERVERWLAALDAALKR